MDLIDYAMIFGGIALTVYLILIFNNLISLKNNVSKAWSNIDVLLKQRNDELPKLIETCKQYMSYEKSTLEQITEARTLVMDARQDANISALGTAETQLRTGLGNLFALAEDYPELKANETFKHLQVRISRLENAIADRRELYNDSATLNNIRIEQFPDIIVATILRFKHRDMLEFTSEELQDVDVKELFVQ